MYSNGTVARLGVMPRWLLADADRWRVGSAGRSYRPLRTPPISEHSHRVLAIVLHAANALAMPAPRPPHDVVPGLRGDNLPLDPRQHQLRFGQGQTHIGDVDEAIGPADLHDVCARPLAFRPDFHQPQNPSHVSTLGQRTRAEIPDRRRTPNLATVPDPSGESGLNAMQWEQYEPRRHRAVRFNADCAEVTARTPPPIDIGSLKVAIIHYWFIYRRGGERVVEALCELFPRADVFTHVIDSREFPDLVSRHRVVTSFVQRLPFARRALQFYLPLMPFALEQFDLTDYDLVISIESGPAKGVLVREDSVHICYCNSPMRYIWNKHS